MDEHHPSWSSLARWRVRRPLTRGRLHSTLRAHPGTRLLSVRDLVRAAGLEGIPDRELHAALGDLVDAGRAEGMRGTRGWLYIRALPLTPAAPLHDDTWPERDRIAPSRSRPYRLSGGSAIRTFRRLVHGGTARIESNGRASRAPHGTAGGWVSAPVAVLPAPSAMRNFSVTTRLRERRAGGILAGLAMFAVAMTVSVVASRAVIGRDASEAQSTPSTRAEWYRQTARAYVDAHLARRPGYDLPHGFVETTGVAANAPRAALVRGMEEYLRGALFTGFPSRGGILAWARANLGELPAGPAGDVWIQSVSEQFAARSLAAAPGFEITAALQSAGSIAPGERDPVALTAGVNRALRAALYLGTPDSGGLLDWARRTVGELPERE